MSRRPYEKPQIIRHHRSVVNHFGRDPSQAPLTEVGGVSVDALMEEYGSPLFVFDEASLRERARALRTLLDDHYPEYRVVWSYKTNYLDAICRVFHDEGWGAEVVSASEYEMARRLGIPGEDIVYNGAWKPGSSLRRAADEGALIQVDHFDELDALEDLASERDEPLAVALRVNMNVKSLTAGWHRFGFNLDTGEAKTAARRVAIHPSLRLCGLHTHLGTYITLPAAYREAAGRLARFALECELESGEPVKFLNLGGGFPSRNDLGAGGSAEGLPEMGAFVAELTAGLREQYPADCLPTLILETGRALVDEAGVLLATVVGTRPGPRGERGIVLDAGVNLLYTANWYRHRLVTTRRGVPGRLVPTTVYGPLCMNIDVVRREMLLPPLEAGDRVAISPVGAYNTTQWMQFCQLRPAVVMVGEDRKVAVIRSGEDVEYLKALEHVPEWLGRDEIEGQT